MRNFNGRATPDLECAGSRQELGCRHERPSVACQTDYGIGRCWSVPCSEKDKIRQWGRRRRRRYGARGLRTCRCLPPSMCRLRTMLIPKTVDRHTSQWGQGSRMEDNFCLCPALARPIGWITTRSSTTVFRSFSCHAFMWIGAASWQAGTGRKSVVALWR